MTDWKKDELQRLAKSEEVDVAPLRRDGSAGARVTIWAVEHADALFVRSAVKGRDAAWYRGVQRTHHGRIWGGAMEKDVAFVDDTKVNDEVDAAYRTKYRRYAGRILDSCLTPEARATTMRLEPRVR